MRFRSPVKSIVTLTGQFIPTEKGRGFVQLIVRNMLSKGDLES